MSEPNEGNLEAGGIAPSSPSQPLEAKLAKLESELAAAMKKIETHDGAVKAFQSGKDKRYDRVEEEFKPLKEQVAKIAGVLGISETEVLKAQRELTLDELVNERMRGNPQPQQVAQGNASKQGGAVEFDIVDELLELPKNDPRVTQLRLENKDVVAYKEAAKAFRASLSANPPTPAEQLPPQGSAARRDGAEELQRRYLEEMNDARGKGYVAGNAIKAKYREKGVPVDDLLLSV